MRTTYKEDPFHYFKFNGESTLYNLYDAGNYMWGNWMKFNNWSYGTARFGSQANELGFDSAADQRAIKSGYHH